MYQSVFRGAYIYALGSSQYPVLKVPRGPRPSLAPRCGARKNYTSNPYPVSRKILKKFSDPFSGAPGALRALAPLSRPASRAFAAGVCHYTSPRRFAKGVIRKNFRRASIPLAAVLAQSAIYEKSVHGHIHARLPAYLYMVILQFADAIFTHLSRISETKFYAKTNLR